MATPAQCEGLASAQLGPGPLHLAIGMFDGVHLGHRAVIEPAVQTARQQRGSAAVLTFWPHPSALFRPDHPTRLIQSPAAKARVLGSLGIDVVITERFTAGFASIEAEAFLPWLQERLPTLRGIYVGENFRFGRKRLGDVSVLRASASTMGISLASAGRVSVAGEPVSSTRIRGLLEAGEIEPANALLGYPYFAEGVVERGKQLGRTIGFPTLNIGWQPELRPRLGVYAVRVNDASAPGVSVPGVANYGLRPTVENATAPRLEIHVLGDCRWTEGSAIIVEWHRFLRPEQKFSSVEELRAQIAKDREAAAAQSSG